MTYREREGEYRDARPYQGRRQAVHCCRELSPVRLAALLRCTPGVVRDLDLTAACGIEAADLPKRQRGCRIPVNRH